MNNIIQTKIYDLTGYSLSERYGTYGGNSGSKECILIGNDHWIIKYPHNSANLNKGGSLSCSASSLSEYIGSHVFSLLGYNVHDTILGIRRGKLVVACKDFCMDDDRLIEYRQLRNTYCEEAKNALAKRVYVTKNRHLSNLYEIEAHLEHNPLLRGLEGIKQHFWETAVIDGLINNNDRSNDSWGIIRNDKRTVIAPIYSNAGSFSPEESDSKLQDRLSNELIMIDSINRDVTSYSMDGEHCLLYKEFLLLDNKDLHEAIIKVVPKIQENIGQIHAFIEFIPEEYAGIEVISKVRKKEYISEMDARIKWLLDPQYKNVLQRTKKHDDTI